MSKRLWQLSDQERKERLYLPWRRLLGRGFDLIIYMLIWWIVAYLAFRWNIILLHVIVLAALMFGSGLVLMILLEPLLLAFFSTTPGKALFGIHLQTAQGNKITVKQGYSRVFRVMSKGCGYVVIPIYSLVRMYKSCAKCQVDGVTPWDGEVYCSVSGDFRYRIVLGINAILISVFLFVGVYYAADMPELRGPLTAAQFEENLESYWQFHDTQWNAPLSFEMGLILQEINVGYIFDRMNPPIVTLDEADGVLTGVSIRIDDAPRIVMQVLPDWITGYTMSFVGAQRGMNFIRMHSPRGVLNTVNAPLNEIGNREGAANINFTSAGVEVSLDLDVGHRVYAYFRMRKL